MKLWHLTPDTPRTPYRVSAGESIRLEIGTWPIEAGQEVWVVERTGKASKKDSDRAVPAIWTHNAGENSYWRAEFGPFADGEVVRYTVRGRGPGGEVTGPSAQFQVGPKLRLALLWHQHQPLYRDLTAASARGSYLRPWVRLHAIRDYYSMAALVAAHPGVHLTINFTPVLLRQIEDYALHGATDRALDLTLISAGRLTIAQQDEVLSTFFDAHWHNQIFPHPRYKELFERRLIGQPFTITELRDLQMWSNLAWFGKEFRDGAVQLATGEVASVRRFVDQDHGFSIADIDALIAEQLKILGAIIPIHRMLQERGQIEVSTTPYTHPILPLLVDTDQAAIDRPGTVHPKRFAHPEDADTQVRLAVEHYVHCFGRKPRGMWPAEGAVSQSIVPILAHHGIEWIATDGGVLARSGRWGYHTNDPDVICQPYQVVEGDDRLSIFFRDGWLSDHIGFHYQDYTSYDAAAGEFLANIKEKFAQRLFGDSDRVLTVVLDGENAWGAYREDARPFLHALYTRIEQDTELQTVTFAEYLDGDAWRRLAPHPIGEQERVHDLFTGSWIDEAGSASGVDLGTWIGEVEENRAWEMLGRARAEIDRRGATSASAPVAFDALYAAEGSDWFWWYGDDQDSGVDDQMDELFRHHLHALYGALGADSPPDLNEPIIAPATIWTFASPVQRVGPSDRLTVQTNCPGVLIWQVDDGPERELVLVPSGGVMAAAHFYHGGFGPFDDGAQRLHFRLRCTERGCDGTEICCHAGDQSVMIAVADPT